MRPHLLAVPVISLVATACVAPAPPSVHQQPVDVVKGVPIIDVQLNGVSTRCVVDTGNASFFVHPDFGGTPWNGWDTPEYFTVDSLILANWEFQGDAITASSSYFDDWEEELGVTGIGCWLGNGVLASTRLTIDYAGGVLEMADPSERVMRPFGTSSEEIVIDALYDEFLMVASVNLADDFDAIMMFDSGAGFVTLSPDAYDDLDNPPELTQIGDIPFGKLDSMSIGAVDAGGRVDDVTFVSWEDPQLESLSSIVELTVDGTVGASYLGAFTVTWDFPNGQMRLRPYDAEIRDAYLQQLEGELGF